MKRFFRIAKSRRLLLLALAFVPLCFGVLIRGAGLSQPQSAAKGDLKIINRTTTLEVVSVQPTDHNLLAIKFKNISTKGLNGYAVAFNGARITKDLSSGDRVIAPGNTDDLEIPSNLSSSDLTILAAMFSDGSVEGDSIVGAELKEWRIGLKEELRRALTLFERAMDSPDVFELDVLDRLESQLLSHSVESADAKPHSLSSSEEARNTLKTELQMLRDRRRRNGAHMQRQRLLDLKARIERRIASL
jgi:hypothetical protein